MDFTQVYQLQAKVLGTLSPEVTNCWEFKSRGSQPSSMNFYARDPEANHGYLSGLNLCRLLESLRAIGCSAIVGNIEGECAPVVFIEDFNL